MIVTKYTCDQCGEDLTETTNCEDWRIVLNSERIPPCRGAVTAMMIEPDFERPYHFCGTKCFFDYVMECRNANVL